MKNRRQQKLPMRMTRFRFNKKRVQSSQYKYVLAELKESMIKETKEGMMRVYIIQGISIKR